MREWAIFSGPDWYRPSMTSTKQFARQFHKHGFKVLWINPVAFKSPFVNSSSRASAWKKIVNKARTHLFFLRKADTGFIVWVPLYMPAFGPRATAINDFLFKAQFFFICFLLRIPAHKSILWVSGSFTALPILHMFFACKIYQAADLISGFRDASSKLKTSLKARECRLCQETDIRFAATERIADALEQLGRKHVNLLHHGVEYDHFASPGAIHRDMIEIRQQGSAVVGYFGSLGDANDKDALLALANNGFSVVLIGKVLGDYSALEENEKVYFMGPVDYKILPSYARGFDIGLLNWRAGEWIDNCFPVKALEYLAAGLPVVSCPIPVLQQHYADVVAFAETPSEFVEQCRKAIAEDSDVMRQMRRERVKNCSWDQRYRFVKELMNECRICPD